MASVKFDRREFEKHIKVTPEIEEKIRLFGTPLESVTSEHVEVEIFPNRPDLLSLQGYVRALSAFLGKEKGIRKYKLNKPQKDYKVIIDSSVDSVRPFTACAIVRDLKFTDEKIKEIVDLQEKLHMTIGRNRKKMAIGIYPLEKISLPISYKAESPKSIVFRPLEADREMNALEILQKHPTGKEYARLLSNANEFPVFRDSKGAVLSMPPIINSHETGKVTTSTKEVFIECSGFDFSLLQKILSIIVTTLADQGGEAYQMELVRKAGKTITPDFTPQKSKVHLADVNRLLGMDLKEAELASLLSKMGHEYSKGIALTPAWRTDIMHEVDFVEDVAIAYGYDRIEPQLPEVATVAAESSVEKLKSCVREVLVGLGMVEISSYHLIKGDEKELAKVEGAIEVENSKTDYKFLRPNLSLPALRILTENKDNEYPQNIFELGTIFSMGERGQINESQSIVVAMTPANFTQIRQVAERLMSQLGLAAAFKEADNSLLIPGRASALLIGNEEIGHLGEVHPAALKDWSIKMPVALMEISLDKLMSALSLK